MASPSGQTPLRSARRRQSAQQSSSGDVPSKSPRSTPRSASHQSKTNHQQESASRRKRGFSPVAIRELSAESGEERFAASENFAEDGETSDGQRGDAMPQNNLVTYRGNLTALCSTESFYIVAVGNRLMVHEPTQVFAKTPARASLLAVLDPQTLAFETGCSGLVTDRLRENYEPPQRTAGVPRCINHVMAGMLGSEEIVLVGCDDGFVVAWQVRNIASYVDKHRRWYREAHKPKDTEWTYHTEPLYDEQDEILNMIPPSNSWYETVKADAVTPLFVEAVDESVWGLAIHQSARLIAVSANSQEITVFAFGLHHATYKQQRHVLHNDNKFNLFEDIVERHHFDFWDPTLRSQNWYMVLENGHDTNIPTISFYQSDVNERILLASGDIDGVTIVWDVSSRQPLRTVEPAPAPFPLFQEPQLSSLGVWAVLLLDPRSFERAKGLCQATGGCRLVECTGLPTLQESEKLATTAVDLEASVKLIEQNITFDIRPATERPRTSIQTALNVLQSLQNVQEESDDSMDEYTNEESDTQSSTPTRNTLRNSLPSIPHDDPVKNETRRAQMVVRANLNEESPVHTVDMPSTPHQAWDTLEWERFDIFKLRHEKSTRKLLRQVEIPPLIQIMPKLAILHQPLSAPLPPVMLRDPLAQRLPGIWNNMVENLDRMALVTQIPELGVVLLGSLKGRVAVLTLHHLPDPSCFIKSSTNKTDQTAATSSPIFSMRLDAILPLPEQEKKHKRPFKCLAGVSAAPTQPGKRTNSWTVMLTYTDYTVLAYNVRRSGSGMATLSATKSSKGVNGSS